MPFHLHGSENMPITAYLQIKKNSKKKEKAFIKAHSYQKNVSMHPTEDRNYVFPREKKPSDSCGKEYHKAFGNMKA